MTKYEIHAVERTLQRVRYFVDAESEEEARELFEDGETDFSDVIETFSCDQSDIEQVIPLRPVIAGILYEEAT